MTHEIRYRRYRRAFHAPLRTAHGWWREREGLIVRLSDESGRIGWGEVAPLPPFGTETLEEAESVCAALGNRVTEETLARIDPRFGCVRFALASARPSQERTKAPSARLPVAALLPAGKAAVAALEQRLEAGFLAFKWKVGVEAAPDEWVVLDDLLSRLPAYARLRLDANEAWDRRTAEKWLARVSERPIEFVEQPVRRDARDLLFGLAGDYPAKLALDESVTGLASAQEWQKDGWSGVFVIKPALAGPLEELVNWGNATKPDLVFSSALETAIGRAAILRTLLPSGLTQRALGFGVGEIFGARTWDGPHLGPLLDASWGDNVNPEDLWNELN